MKEKQRHRVLMHKFCKKIERFIKFFCVLVIISYQSNRSWPYISNSYQKLTQLDKPVKVFFKKKRLLKTILNFGKCL